MLQTGRIDLSLAAGLPLRLAERGLEFGADTECAEVHARSINDLADVRVDGGTALGGPDPAYVLYRGVARATERRRFSDAGLRFDVTVLRSGRLGTEHNKTFGHIHVGDSRSPQGYPELFQVIYGTVVWLLFALRGDGSVADVAAIRGAPGDMLLAPASFYHVAVNPGERPLVMADLVWDASTNDYGTLRSRRGAPYYALVGPTGRTTYVPNTRYERIPPLRVANSGTGRPLDIVGEMPLYAAVSARIEAFSYLGGVP